MNQKWIFLISSAVLYALAFIFSQWLWWVIFFAFIPLFYLGAYQNLSFKDGFLWGILIWVLHLHGILYFIILLAQGNPIFRIIPAIFIVVYQAFFVGLWFALASGLIRILQLEKDHYLRIIIWIMASFIYFYWLIHYCLCIFNYWEGYFMMYPLLPLAEYPALLTWLPSHGKNLLMLFLLVTNGLLAACFIVQRELFAVILFFLAFAPWIGGILTVQKPVIAPHWLKRVIHVPFIFLDSYDLSQLAKTMQSYLKALIQKYPDADIFLFPESSFERINLSSAPEMAELWDTKHLSKPVHILIGAYEWQGSHYYNALYWIYDGKIQKTFKKRHKMVLVEGVSDWWDFSFIRKLYYNATPPVTASSNPRVSFPLVESPVEGESFVPYICSELFFNDQPDDKYKDATTLAVCNDLWAKISFVRRLMYLTARFKAMEWQRDTLYISYFYGVFISKKGNVTFLPLSADDIKDVNYRLGFLETQK